MSFIERTSIVIPTKLAMPPIISFSLQGRRTLLENMPSETIDVRMSTINRSPHLSNILTQNNLPSSTPIIIPLVSTDPAAFKIYISWLNTERTSIPTLKHSSRTSQSRLLLLRDATDLLYAHILGTHFSEPFFQDQIIDTLQECLDPAQAPDLQVLQIVYTERGVKDVLVRFVVDWMFKVERSMVSVLRGEREDIQGNGMCRYHVHDRGRCYVDMLNDRDTREPRSVAGVNKPLPSVPNQNGRPRLNIQAHGKDLSAESVRTKTLVSECLDRLQTGRSLSRSTSVSASTSSLEKTKVLGNLLPDICLDPSDLIGSPAMIYEQQKSVDKATSRVPTPRPQHMHRESLMRKSSPVLSPRPSIERKPVSLRGLDWLIQYDRVNSMLALTSTSTQPAKRSNRSKFREHVESTKSRFSNLEPDLQYH